MLAAVDEQFGCWFQKGSRRSLAGRELETSVEGLRAAFAAGRNRRDVDGSVMDKLGWTVSVWNGDDAFPVALAMRCGISQSGLSNAVVVNMPAISGESADSDRSVSSKAIVRAVVKAFDPDWATVTSNALRDAQKASVGRPVLGWLTYFSAKRGPVPALPEPFRVEEVAQMGSIVAVDEAAIVDPPLLTKLAGVLGPNLLRPAA
jgi:hypothetical protein